MYRERLFPCGLCTAAMKPVTLPGDGDERVVVDICEACRCVFIEYFDGEPATIARSLRSESLMQVTALGDLTGPSNAATAANETAQCPECAISMQLMLYLDEGPPVHRCDQCMAILATAAQVAALAQFVQLEKPDDGDSDTGLFAFLRRLFY